MARSSRSSSFKRTRGSLGASSIPSFSHVQRVRIRCSQASSLRQPKRERLAPSGGGQCSNQPNRVDRLFPPDRLFVIAGPCVVEDDALNMRVAAEIARLE